MYKKSSIFLSEDVKIDNNATNKSTQREYYDKKRKKK